ncbi:dTMP kinase [Lactobacillus sp.] [Lactiplantibacillus mudanjiangensis]|uniref:Thymidylate kinase n=1 Tax=Lactiplantibacillus mudanjiangensis TaxID=1296538 RepID=A0A660E2K8_9LACO|nr:dTMP kinase [Lactobacillus sp.] [Lactiplantibacillus mudanjiangensis]VDG24853.1 dTMP kinase [Lactobacillus sp.] [Lactiplantibacillus mudanjiangensis]VDG28399.1 dTMP kinase [Lactobacillus sp.] [Lactiplantibacillus mudanjiangensis]VDG32316.1 dTMP kinase [Lactobacillus sp.] [Lactiplantibacillus mudanjiangensis]
MTGKLITFEGPDGAGKTSALNAIVAQIQPQLGDRLVVTREPGGNQISESIRQIILDRHNTAMDKRTEALLYAAARRQHIVQKILPALKGDQLVLCDRFIDSSIAYQGAGRGIGEDAVATMNEFATEGLTPDLTLYFDVDAAVGLKRIQTHRQDEINRLDVEALSFHHRVQAAYLRLLAANPDRIKRVDASQSLDQVVAQGLAIIQTKLPQYFTTEGKSKL